MKRRWFLRKSALIAAGLMRLPSSLLADTLKPAAQSKFSFDEISRKNWLARWEENILSVERERYCDQKVGEDIGWLISPVLNGFLYGYLATRDMKWVSHFADWTNSWIRRGVKGPDGYIGWPEKRTGDTPSEEFLADSLLGEAMGLRPVVRMADKIRKRPELRVEFGAHADAWLALAAQVFEKWNSRDCWRKSRIGGLWVDPAYGMDPTTGNWTAGFARRKTEGISHPDNKQNLIAQWLLTMHDVTRMPMYRERAVQWFRLMRSRMRTRAGGRYFVWNYWEPGGRWDYKPDGSTRHWVGVHPNGAYYEIDVEAIVAAFEHGVVFARPDIEKLIATNRDFMWNHHLERARFKRIDGGTPDDRWKNSPGLLWNALVPYDGTLRRIFVANNDPGSWEGMTATPWFLAREKAAG